MTSTLEKNTYAQGLAKLESSFAGANETWLRDLRHRAMERFSALGFPSMRQEAWRFTPVDPIAQGTFQMSEKAGSVSEAQVESWSYGLEAWRLVFIDGRFAKTLSKLPANGSIKVGPISSLLPAHAKDLQAHLGKLATFDDQSFTALNTALFADGAHVYLPQGTVVEKPIHVLSISTVEAGQSHARLLWVSERDTQATLIESFVSSGHQTTFSNGVSEIVLEDNARLDHYKIVRGGAATYQVSSTHVSQARSSFYQSHAFLLSGALVRNNIQINLGAEGAECVLNGLYMVTGKQLMDSHTLVDHVKPHGTSRQLYKGVLDETAQAVFDGHVIVRGEAQKTDSSQTNKNLLLSDKAKVNTKPELKIFANDVKCKHGATIGQIEPASLFYLRSRGIPSEAARRLLIRAFANDMVERIEVPALRETLGNLICPI